MDNSKDGGPAFPIPETFGESKPGMSLRQWYAGLAMQAMLANPNLSVNTASIAISEWAFQQAESMIKKGRE